MSEWTDAPRPDLTAADWAAMRARKCERLSVCEHVHTEGACEFTHGVLISRTERDGLLDALARQQEATTRIWELVTTRDAMLADRDATIARLRSLLEQALNGWSAFAKRKIELADISRIHAALTPAKEADRG